MSEPGLSRFSGRYKRIVYIMTFDGTNNVYYFYGCQPGEKYTYKCIKSKFVLDPMMWKELPPENNGRNVETRWKIRPGWQARFDSKERIVETRENPLDIGKRARERRMRELDKGKISFIQAVNEVRKEKTMSYLNLKQSEVNKMRDNDNRSDQQVVLDAEGKVIVTISYFNSKKDRQVTRKKVMSKKAVKEFLRAD